MKTILDFTLRYWFWNRVQIIVSKINGKLRISLYFFEYSDGVEDWVIAKIRYIGENDNEKINKNTKKNNKGKNGA